MLTRCDWCSDDPIYQDYHDHVWGRPVTDARDLFAKLCLDGQQAGLSWITILKKQPAYYDAFAQFDPVRLAQFNADDVDRLMTDPGIVRNRLKIESILRNARAYLAMEAEGEDFVPFIWSFVEYQPQINQWAQIKDVPVTTAESEAMSRALKKRGFNFVGPTICYAFMQATGLVMDHLVSCHCHDECRELARTFRVSQ
ncbi:MAG: DNA-3-methyladenine glycosylase I [Saccharospirillum sp.]|nr:DNA-3-methyladenine glycosylase I [Saccharospirillum sp.]